MKRFIREWVFRIQMLIIMRQLPPWSFASIMAAVVIGYNELAKQQTDIRQRAICRLMRDVAIRAAGQFGLAVPEMRGNPMTFRIVAPGIVPPLEFRESDWELIRQALHEHDTRGNW